MQFIPHVLPVVAGTTVKFLNSDPTPHNVFSPGQREVQPRHLAAGAVEGLRLHQVREVPVRLHAALPRPPRDGGLRRRAAEPVLRGLGQGRALTRSRTCRPGSTRSPCGTRSCKAQPKPVTVEAGKPATRRLRPRRAERAGDDGLLRRATRRSFPTSSTSSTSCRAGPPVRSTPTRAATFAPSPRATRRAATRSRARRTRWRRSAAASAPIRARRNAGGASIDQPISIRALKRTLTERHGVENTLRRPAGAARTAAPGGEAGRRRPPASAVVGAGPAGLSCAHDLALLGYRVTIFDAAPVVGGMLYQGVPEYRLSRDLIRAEVDQILSLGVELKLEWRLGRDFTVGDLRRNGYAAVFLALGAIARPRAEHPGQGSRRRHQRRRLPAQRQPRLPRGARRAGDRHRRRQRRHRRRANRAAVRGVGGDGRSCRAAPSSCCRRGATTTRSSTRRGPRCAWARATCSSCRSNRAPQMPAHPDEVREAEEEGITLVPGLRAEGDPRARRADVVGLETLDVASLFDANGRFNPTFVAGQRASASTPTRSSWPWASSPTPSCLAADPEIDDHAARPGRGRPAHAGDDDGRRLLRRRPGVRAAHRDRGGGRRQAGGARDSRIPRRRAVPARAGAFPADRPRTAPATATTASRARRSRRCRSRAARAFARSRRATARRRRASRRRAACGATSRRSSTPSAASCAAAASRSVPRPA